MTVEKLIAKLNKEINEKKLAIKTLEQFITVKVKKKRMPSGNTHWMRKPENKDKVMKMIRKMHRARKANATIERN